MPVVVWIIAITLFFYLLILLNPLGIIAVVAELKRRWRLHLINKYGREDAEEVFEMLREHATKKGYDQKAIEMTINQLRDELTQELGEKAANAILGEPTPFEKYF